jgi:cytochrome c oxidase subunit 2
LAIVQINVWADIKYPASMQPDKNTMQIEVTARQWEWRIRYPSSQRMKGWQDGSDKTLDDFRIVGFDNNGQFDDVHLVNELHVVQGEKVLVWLKTRDVIHSFFLPNVRLKQDALPGKTIPVWFTVENRDGKNYNCHKSEKTGVWESGFDPEKNVEDVASQYWDLVCAEFCGSRHSLMRGRLYVHKDRPDFYNWLESAEARQKSGQESTK